MIVGWGGEGGGLGQIPYIYSRRLLLKKKSLIQVSSADLHWRSTDAVANDMKSGFLDFRITQKAPLRTTEYKSGKLTPNEYKIDCLLFPYLIFKQARLNAAFKSVLVLPHSLLLFAIRKWYFFTQRQLSFGTNCKHKQHFQRQASYVRCQADSVSSSVKIENKQEFINYQASYSFKKTNSVCDKVLVYKVGDWSQITGTTFS